MQSSEQNGFGKFLVLLPSRNPDEKECFVQPDCVVQEGVVHHLLVLIYKGRKAALSCKISFAPFEDAAQGGDCIFLFKHAASLLQ